MDIGIGWPGGDIESTIRLAVLIVGSYVALIWVVSVLWVYRDIRARTRDIITHLTAVAIALGLPLLGLPLYFVLRPRQTLEEVYGRQLEQEAMLSELHAVSACPQCRRPVQDDFMICAHCRTQLRVSCDTCGRLLQYAWRNCPYCATPRLRPAPPQEREAPVAGDEGARRALQRETGGAEQQLPGARRRAAEESAPVSRSPDERRGEAPAAGQAVEEHQPESAPRRRPGSGIRRPAGPTFDATADRERGSGDGGERPT